MTPLTKDEPPSKKQRLVVKMPSDIDNRQKMPLHLVKSVFRHLTREQQELLRPVCSFWNRCVATRPSHFEPLFKLSHLYCGWFGPDDPKAQHMGGVSSWPDISRNMSCCDHLKDLATQLAGELFLPQKPDDAYINIQVLQKSPKKRIGYHFRNKLSKKTAFPVLHLSFHLGQLSFNSIGKNDASFLCSMRPEIAALFLPIRCHYLIIDIEHSQADIPSPGSLAVVKSQETEWHLDGENMGSLSMRMKGLLQNFAVDARHIYKRTSFWVRGGVANNEHGTDLLKSVVELFSKALKDSREIVPHVDIQFCFEDGGLEWPLAPFSDMQPTHVEEHTRTERWGEGEDEDEDEEEGEVTIVERAFDYKISSGGGPGAQTFDVEVECAKYGEEYEYIREIRFLFELCGGDIA